MYVSFLFDALFTLLTHCLNILLNIASGILLIFIRIADSEGEKLSYL